MSEVNNQVMSRISTHALLAEGDFWLTAVSSYLLEFQPTPSLRRATGDGTRPCPQTYHFNPRPPCGGRHVEARIRERFSEISTHALLAEGDGKLEQ